MGDPSSPTGAAPGHPVSVVVSDEQSELPVDAARWSSLAGAALAAEGCTGELTLTFVDRDEIAALNVEHLGGSGPTDVLSFPLEPFGSDVPGPSLIGDVVICPGVAADQATTHAGTLDDELALLVVHGVLHVAGHDHAEPYEARRMRERELELLEQLHWGGPAPDGFRQTHDDDRDEVAPWIAVQFTGVDLLMLVAILLILVVLIFLAVAETALNRISKVKAQALAESLDTKPAHALERLVTHPERFINPVLVTVTFLQTGQAFLTSLLAARMFGPLGVVIGFVLNVVVFFVLSEAMPKTWAVLSAERAALGTARLVELIVSFPPLRLISRGLIGLTNVLLPGKGLKQGPFVSEQELLGIVEAAAEDEVIEHEERELIESIIEFGDTVAREVMMPRPDMVIIPNEATVTDALDLAISHGYSRLPVFGPGDDDVIGLAYTKDLIRAEREGRGDLSVLDLVRPVRFIPENKPVSRLMREMQAGKFHLAIVADEYGGIAGLVTLEDCLEELVGEIVDEYDIEEHTVERLPDGDYLVDGGTSIDELNELLGVSLPNEDWDTLGGLVFNTLGHVPDEGEQLEIDGWRFTAEEIEGRRIRLVRVRLLPVTEEQPDPGLV